MIFIYNHTLLVRLGGIRRVWLSRGLFGEMQLYLRLELGPNEPRMLRTEVYPKKKH